MARRVFFSFHYQRDIFRTNVVRNSWVTRGYGEAVPFYDNSLWEAAKRSGDAAIKRLIDRGLYGASVTCLLIGAETAERRYVQYEIEQSYSDKGLLGVYINGIRDPKTGRTDLRGGNPFDNFYVDGESLATYVPTYDWVRDDGYSNFDEWVEEAAASVGR